MAAVAVAAVRGCCPHYQYDYHCPSPVPPHPVGTLGSMVSWLLAVPRPPGFQTRYVVPRSSCGEVFVSQAVGARLYGNVLMVDVLVLAFVLGVFACERWRAGLWGNGCLDAWKTERSDVCVVLSSGQGFSQAKCTRICVKTSPQQQGPRTYLATKVVLSHHVVRRSVNVHKWPAFAATRHTRSSRSVNALYVPAFSAHFQCG